MDVAEGASAVGRQGTGDSVRHVLRAVGELLITLGLVVLLFAAYELWGTGLVTQREQRRLAEDLVEAWREPVPVSPAEPRDEDSAVVEPGTGIAVLRIPVLGEDWSKVVVEGTGREELKQGPGRMPGTGQLGAVGNAVVAGHRTTYGAPFADLDRLAADDEVIVETRQAVFTYRVYDSEVVQPTDVAVALPVPRRPGITPTKSLVTLTTCTPKYTAKQRLIVYAQLVESRPRRPTTSSQ